MVKRWTLLAFVAVLAARTAAAQLELPEKPVEAKGQGTGVTIPPKPPGDLAEKSGGGAQKSDGTVPKSEGADHKRPGEKLDLPSELSHAKPAAAKDAPTGQATPAAKSGAPAVDPKSAPATGVPNNAAAFVLGEVRKLKSVDDTLATHAVDSLMQMGPAGREAALAALYDDNAACVLVGARVLLQGGAPEDCERVQQRLRTRLPNAACAPLVETLAALDPVHASPAFLAELLGHKQSGVRNAAQRLLDGLATELPLTAITPLLAAKEIDTRLRAVHMLARSNDEQALALLVDRLGDPSSVVARKAVDVLADRESEWLDAELLKRAFSERWILREQSYELLAIVEREDSSLRPLLNDLHAGALLDGMDSKDPFISGCCATALAGIGFRTTAVDATRWLDREVPHKLVRVVGAADFSPDYSSLIDIAARRLAMIAGADFGSDGPAWLDWWAKNADPSKGDTFRARRAVLAVRDEDAPSLRIAVQSNTAAPEAFGLLGPAFAEAATTLTGANALQGETLFFSDGQARALLDLLRKQGVFETRRLPGVRGSRDLAGTTLTVGVGARDKQFRFSGVAADDWFESCVEAARQLRDRNRWQRYLDTSHATAADAWRAESAWWDQAHTQAELDRRLVQMILVNLAARPNADRDSGIAELQRLAGEPGALAYADFAPLLDLLRAEHFVGPRARTLVTLAIAAAREGAEPRGANLPEEFAHDLVSALVASIGPRSAELVASVLDAAGRETTRKYAADKDPFVRAVAAATLARNAAPEDVDVLLRLLDDPVEDVQASAVLALGENKVDAARTPVLIRARVAQPAVRVNALIAAGMLGGENALDALLSGLTERSQPAVYVAAARGLALLHDPQTTPLLISILSRGNTDPAFEYARKGLIDLGEPAWSDLLRVVHTPSHKALREAALILSEQCVPQAVSALMTYLTDHRDDAHVAGELAVLTCVDKRTELDPAVAWWNWWEGVVHDDAQAWFCAAVARVGISTPAPETLRSGDRDVLVFLINVLQRPEQHLAERARRELARTLKRDIGPLPQVGPERDAWISALRETVDTLHK